MTSETTKTLADIRNMDKKEFLEDLVEYTTSIGKPIGKSPVMGYKELDLHQLFCEVMSYGGFHEVVKKVGTWAKIWKRLDNFDASVTDASYRLKKNYERCLLDYEYKLFPENKSKQFMSSPRNSYKRDYAGFLSSTPTARSTTSPPLHSLSHPHFSYLNSNVVDNSSPVSSAPSSPSIHPKGFSSSSDISATSRPIRSASLAALSFISQQTQNLSSLDESMDSSASIERDANGSPVLPINLGDVVVESLGVVVPRSPFVTSNNIYPVGFRSVKTFTSAKDPSTQTRYTSQILDIGGRPMFMVIAADDPTAPIISNSAMQAWKTVLQRITAKGGDYQRGKATNVSGSKFFGLSNQIIKDLVKELPDGNKAVQLQNSLTKNRGLKKRKFSSDEEDEEEDLEDEPQKKMSRSHELSSSSQDELTEYSASPADDEEDLEMAIATLSSLKYVSNPVAVN